MSETNKVVGYRQTLKMLKAGRAARVVLARDTDAEMAEALLARCRETDVPVEMVAGKAELGRLCGIERPAAVAAYLK